MNLMGLFDKDALYQLTRYAAVGCLINALGYSLFLLITHVFSEPKLVMSFLYLVGMTVSFFCNLSWVFPKQKKISTAVFRFFIAHALGYLINLSILIIFVDYFRYPYQWVQAACIFIVAGFLFLLFKFFVFSEKKIDLVSN